VRQSPAGTDVGDDFVEIRYQATASENTEDLTCAVVRSKRISESVIITCRYDL
jgi:hypothetical protein